MGNKVEDFIVKMIVVMIVLAFIFCGVAWERYRWHAWQDVTGRHDVGFWKWSVVIDGGHRK